MQRQLEDQEPEEMLLAAATRQVSGRDRSVALAATRASETPPAVFSCLCMKNAAAARGSAIH